MSIRTITGRTLALLALAAGSLVTAGASPAAAAPDCIIIKVLYEYGGNIEAEADRFCYPDGSEELVTATIYRQDAAGSWVLVATGLGFATYHCTGTATTTYRTGPYTRDKTITAACS